MAKNKIICSHCKEELISCDSGNGHKFKIGKIIYKIND